MECELKVEERVTLANKGIEGFVGQTATARGKSRGVAAAGWLRGGML